jgi:hypothetical protein
MREMLSDRLKFYPFQSVHIAFLSVSAKVCNASLLLTQNSIN